MSFLTLLAFLPALLAQKASAASIPNRQAPPSDAVAAFLAERSPGFEWTAWGDSYASGVGAGTYIDGRRCLRYQEAYPQWINDDPDNLLPGTSGGKFNNVVCSGSKAQDVQDYQFYSSDQSSGQPNWQFYPRPSTGNPAIGTLTVGGDDVDFAGILNNCIIEGFPWPLSAGFTPRTCDEQRALSWSLISDGGAKQAPNPNLVIQISSAIQKAVQWGTQQNPDFRLYVTGYGRFFNDKTLGCDNVTFARLANPHPDGKPHVMLTTELRGEFNAMTLMVNQAIQQALVINARAGVRYIDIDSMLAGHRFCEPGITEPDQNNPNLWFFQYPYNQDDGAGDPSIAYLNSVAASSVGTVAWNPSSTLFVDFLNNFWDQVNETALGQAIGATSEDDTAWYNFWSDTIGTRAKLFHPQMAYAEAIYQAIINEYKADTGFDPPPINAPKGPSAPEATATSSESSTSSLSSAPSSASLSSEPTSASSTPASLSLSSTPASLSSEPASASSTPASLSSTPVSLSSEPTSASSTPASLSLSSTPASLSSEPASASSTPASLSSTPASLSSEPTSASSTPASLSLSSTPASLSSEPTSASSTPSSLSSTPASLSSDPTSASSTVPSLSSTPSSLSPTPTSASPTPPSLSSSTSLS